MLLLNDAHLEAYGSSAEASPWTSDNDPWATKSSGDPWAKKPAAEQSTKPARIDDGAELEIPGLAAL